VETLKLSWVINVDFKYRWTLKEMTIAINSVTIYTCMVGIYRTNIFCPFTFLSFFLFFLLDQVGSRKVEKLDLIVELFS
jgi:hypothetical protein